MTRFLIESNFLKSPKKLKDGRRVSAQKHLAENKRWWNSIADVKEIDPKTGEVTKVITKEKIKCDRLKRINSSFFE